MRGGTTGGAEDLPSKKIQDLTGEKIRTSMAVYLFIGDRTERKRGKSTVSSFENREKRQ